MAVKWFISGGRNGGRRRRSSSSSISIILSTYRVTLYFGMLYLGITLGSTENGELVEPGICVWMEVKRRNGECVCTCVCNVNHLVNRYKLYK